MGTVEQVVLNVYLKPGELHVAERPTVVSTLLGSCVSVTMYSRRRGIGAICHAIFPFGSDARHVDHSLLLMLERLGSLSVGRSELEVKMFGGADMMASSRGGEGIMVGRRNVEAALEVIQRQRLFLAASDVGGEFGRKIRFLTHTGDVYLKRISRPREGYAQILDGKGAGCR